MVVLVSVAGAIAGSAPASAAFAPPPIRHVTLIQLENTSFDGAITSNPNHYLAKLLPSLGVLLTSSYATGHESLDNYISQVSGESPNVETQADCQIFTDFTPQQSPLDGNGQVIGQGCVYPPQVKTIGDQLDAGGLSWRGYMEDMGNDPARDNGTNCAHPNVGPTSSDPTQKAAANDQYATRHNPFVYFHSIIDDAARCASHVVPLTRLRSDLLSAATTPSFSWITPNLCDDGHDGPCTGHDVAGKNDGGLVSIDRFLAVYVPLILASPAYQQDGMLIVNFDESGTSDTASCCGEPTGPNTISPGAGGPGGGHVATIVLSKYIKAGTQSSVAYNHYSVLRSLEDVFGVTSGGSDGHGHLGYAGMSGLAAWGADVYSNPSGVGAVTTPGVTPAPTVTGLANTSATVSAAALVSAPAACAVLGLVVAARRRRRGLRS
jgi:hypothetical protein